MKKIAALTLAAFAGSAFVLPAQTAGDLKVKVRSSFTPPPGARNPFWPVGWQKEAPTRVANPKGGKSAGAISDAFFKPERFVVTSISIGAVPLALINGKAYGEGDLIAVNVGGQTVNVQVFAIRDGDVTLRYANKTIVSPIKASPSSKLKSAPPGGKR